MHIGSGVDYQHLADVCDSMVALVTTAGVDLHAISASTPYREGDELIDVQHYYSLWDNARQRIEQHLGHKLNLK